MHTCGILHMELDTIYVLQINDKKKSYSNPHDGYEIPSDISLFGSKYFRTSEIEVFKVTK